MFIKSTDLKEIVSQIKDHLKSHAALISIAENTDIDIDQLIALLHETHIEFMGGIFPKVIHNDSINDSGIVINTLVDAIYIGCIENISNDTALVPKIDFEDNQDYSLITYLDGLTSNISSFLSKLYQEYGMQTNYFGGGAGSLSLEQKPCVFTRQGIFQDAAVMCIMKMKSTIGVKHGWEKLAGPYIVTKAQRNTIQEINWQSPFDIYKEVVESDSAKKFGEDNFFDIAKGYPFGIVRTNDEHVIRDPLIVNGKGELTCVGQVEQNTLVSIMKGKPTSLIAAASKAAKESSEMAVKPQKAMIIDCISRILFLEDDFQKELQSIISVLHDKHPEISISGALTLGEISSFGNGYLEFYNKTVVVGLFE